MPPPRRGGAGALSGDRRPSSLVRLSDVAYIGSNSKTKRPRKTKLCTGVPQVTCDSHTDFKVKRSKVKVTGRGHIVAATACWFLLRSNNWCLNIYILMSYHNGISAEGDFDQWGQRTIGHVTLVDRETNWTELVKRTIWILGDSHRFCDIDFKEVVIWSLIVRQLWLTVRKNIVLSRVQGETPDEHLSHRRWSEIEVEVATCSC